MTDLKQPRNKKQIIFFQVEVVKPVGDMFIILLEKFNWSQKNYT